MLILSEFTPVLNEVRTETALQKHKNKISFRRRDSIISLSIRRRDSSTSLSVKKY